MSFLPNWGFRATVTATHHPKPVRINFNSDDETTEGTNSITLEKFVTTNIPSLANGSKHYLKPWLFNGVLQTMHTFKSDFSKEYVVHFGRRLVDVSEEYIEAHPEYTDLPPGQFTIDYVVDLPESEKDSKIFKKRYDETLPEGNPRLYPRCRFYDDDEMQQEFEKWGSDNKPIVIIVPGLAGGIQEAPIRAVCHELQSKGIHVLVLNSRGSSRSKITTPYLFNGLHTDDLKYVVTHLKAKFQNKKIHLVGFSFGGLIISNYLAFEGDNSSVQSAVTVSAPWDLVESSVHLLNSWSGLYLFAPFVKYFLLNLVKNNISNVADPFFTKENYDNCKKLVKRPIDFDDLHTCKLAGFPSAKSYYYAASPATRIFKIKTPMLVLNTDDDPMVSTDWPVFEVANHPYIYMATTDLGGHYSSVGFDGFLWRNWVSKWVENWDNVSSVEDDGWNVRQEFYKDRVDMY
ncbi:medium-chain fatty acid ethyl ester synthase/esterase [Martiniozyma asiatica (nom. inval.)]|nr:medium-chain fatty acid ethyl ester synthase/esterase [Martiniozyma asiatica]